MSKVYLAGPMTGLTGNRALKWRLFMTGDLAPYGVTCLSPGRGLDYDAVRDIPLTSTGTEERNGSAHAFKRDFYDVQRCDLMVVNFTYCKAAIIGTFIEMGWAYQLNKPIISIGMDIELARHMFMEQMVYVHTDSIDEAVTEVLTFLGVER